MIDITTIKIYNLYVKFQSLSFCPALSWVFFLPSAGLEPGVLT
ncbi:hypothetical protein SpAn4DRAFT_4760 [Sporomusa ovata]|uniref:Uncharacterized protein n=1 Tax=Sporomusa ovata TaxID=2378 RepID=A0A0U1KXB9_9FIRM|nr:hypothetical protein SpAn4DRAFT_4760 [Sporomusa ovata]